MEAMLVMKGVNERCAVDVIHRSVNLSILCFILATFFCKLYES
jgi:hypothetical protein